ncbi:hypothetical protein GCM10011379_21540 [Filimonas zeae]|uniref:Uncharacterized protein n=1 Tax=Filimonas zeae TaxID=1737353 RepID=A0A917IYL9_9BACT|nr:hypothetical protein GCM10011379_21540 [Filimonas zeae]
MNGVFPGFSQNVNNTYIKEAETVNVYSGNVTIGKVIINESLATKLYILSSKQYRDSSGYFVTVIALGNNEKVPVFGVDLDFRFDKPILSANANLMGMSVQESTSENRRNYKLTAAQLNRYPDGIRNVVDLEFKSMFEVKFTIKGVSGNFK